MTIRLKVTMGAIAVILVANSVLSLVILKYVERIWFGEVQNRVTLDLNSARAAYDNQIGRIANFLHAVSLDRGIADALQQNDVGKLDELLRSIRRHGEMDFVSALDARGKVIRRAQNADRMGDDLSGNLMIRKVMEQGKRVSGTIILSREDLEKEGQDLAGQSLAERAYFKILRTEAARRTEDKFRSDGMVIAAAEPVVDTDGRLLGILYAGDLLNKEYEIVDVIRDEVFQHELYEGREIGTVTIFQGDLRISTNVRTADGSRAVGTRLSEAVYDEVLVRGGTWAAPAFVVNARYVTAYEPIRDADNRIIGALYVGLLETPFARRGTLITGGFLAMVAVATLASLTLLFFVTKLVLRPIGHIIEMHNQVVAGDLSARVGIRPPGEMGVLCQAIDDMADAVAERERQLQAATRRQISRSEKLASIGRLAAGVAHEINNPLTGVLTFAHLLRDKQNMDPQDKQDLDLIINETTRASGIVRGLLDFAREGPAAKESLDLNDVIRRTIRLLGNQRVFRQINIVEDLHEGLPRVDGDMNQLQQVLLNLSLNACEAMPDGGTLRISTAAGDGKVLVKVADTGYGIEKEHLDQIFEPFFSMKAAGKGTGLGLSVSYGIVEQHGGTLEVESEAGEGTTFTIVLPSAEDRPSDAPNGKADA